MYYLRARYADTDRGRFWTMDSFEGFGTDPASLHQYAFNHNDPVNRRDPSGHFSLAESQTTVGLAPMVRGALQAMQQSFTRCNLMTAGLAAMQGVALGGAVSGGITALIQNFTGEFDAKEIADAIGEGMVEGAKEGFALGLSPYAFMAYNGYMTFQGGLEFWQVINDPEQPAWVKAMHAATFVATVLPAVSPKLAKRLNDLLEKFCFPAGTLVAVAEGQKPIEEIREGDLVWAQSDATGEISLKRVKQLFVNMAASLVVLTSGTNTLEATPEHPLWVADQGWKAAGQVRVGDELWTRNGERTAVTAIARKQGRFTVFNFEVEDFHTYFVGRVEVLGHNKCNTLPANSKAGKDWEKKLSAHRPPGHLVSEQVTLVVQTPKGPVRIRADQVAMNPQTGKYMLIEGKASVTAPLTSNQREAFQELGKGASATIRGGGGSIFGLDSGDTISFEDVLIVRPTGTTVVR